MKIIPSILLALSVTTAAATSSSVDTQNEKVTHFEDFMDGLLTGALEESDPLIQKCAQDGETVLETITTAVRDIEEETSESVKEGIELMGQAIQEASQDLIECKTALADAEKLEEMALSLKHPLSFVWNAGKNIVVNHVEIQKEIGAAIDAWNEKDYYDAGFNIGEALAAAFVPGEFLLLDEEEIQRLA
uniref:Uncharacterized protein n=1 Tax=Ditylum brightwellii TaxID=49249 RepID=A0A7S4T697_9STRA|mmetsp:Transcript_3359/g.4538  ORF Transcript_3359/g.4538 Transcript_3359/m.4538 type:complete len:189 (+) Transcript_3359:126-692(+)